MYWLPDRELNLRPFGSQANVPCTEPHQPEPAPPGLKDVDH